MQDANHATVLSVRLLGRKIPLPLRVCGRNATGAVGSPTDGAGEVEPSESEPDDTVPEESGEVVPVK